MPRFFVLLGVTIAAAVAASASAAERPRRIVSINLCADELLIALADRDQIASLSVYATDPKLSYFAEKAATYPHDAGEAETVVELEPDLVLAGRYTKRATRDMLTALGYTLDLPPDQRVEGTAATVAIAIARGADIVRVHDVLTMARVAKMTDAIVRSVKRNA